MRKGEKEDNRSDGKKPENKKVTPLQMLSGKRQNLRHGDSNWTPSYSKGRHSKDTPRVLTTVRIGR